MFGVNRSWYLHQCRPAPDQCRPAPDQCRPAPDQCRPAPAASLEEDTRLRDAVERLCLDFPGYGYRRVTAQLRRDGRTVNHKRVLGIMQNGSLLCRLQKAFRPPSAGSTKTAYPNLTQDLTLTKLDQVWVVDMTYIRLPQGFVYLACCRRASCTSPAAAGLRVPRLRLGRVQPPRDRVALGERHRHAPHAGRAEQGDCCSPPWPWLDPSFRSGRSVCKRRVRCPPGRDRG